MSTTLATFSKDANSRNEFSLVLSCHTVVQLKYQHGPPPLGLVGNKYKQCNTVP